MYPSPDVESIGMYWIHFKCNCCKQPFFRMVRRIFVPRSQALPQIISSNRRGGSKGTERLKFYEPCGPALWGPSTRLLDPCFWLSAFSHHPHPLLQRLPGSFRSSLQGVWKKDAWGGMHIGTHDHDNILQCWTWSDCCSSPYWLF